MLKQIKQKAFSIVKNSPLVFHFDELSSTTIRGWVVDQNHPETELTVNLIAKESVLISSKANRLREDVKEHGLGNGFCGFDFNIESLIFNDIDSLNVVVSGDVIKQLSLADLNVVKLPIEDYNFSFDAVTLTSLTGWAIIKDKPDYRPVVKVFVNGNFCGQKAADMFRQDLADAEIQDGNCSFSFPLSVKDLPDSQANIHVYIDNTFAEAFTFEERDVVEAKKNAVIDDFKNLVQNNIDQMLVEIEQHNVTAGADPLAASGACRVLIERVSELSTRLNLIEEKLLTTLDNK